MTAIRLYLHACSEQGWVQHIKKGGQLMGIGSAQTR